MCYVPSLLHAAPSDALTSSPALPPAPLPALWMTCLNDADSVGYERCAVKATLRSLRFHQRSDDIFLLQTVTTRSGEILVGPVETEFQGRLGFR